MLRWMDGSGSAPAAPSSATTGGVLSTVLPMRPARIAAIASAWVSPASKVMRVLSVT